MRSTLPFPRPQIYRPVADTDYIEAFFFCPLNLLFFTILSSNWSATSCGKTGARLRHMEPSARLLHRASKLQQTWAKHRSHRASCNAHYRYKVKTSLVILKRVWLDKSEETLHYTLEINLGVDQMIPPPIHMFEMLLCVDLEHICEGRALTVVSSSSGAQRIHSDTGSLILSAALHAGKARLNPPNPAGLRRAPWTKWQWLLRQFIAQHTTFKRFTFNVCRSGSWVKLTIFEKKNIPEQLSGKWTKIKARSPSEILWLKTRYYPHFFPVN